MLIRIEPPEFPEWSPLFYVSRLDGDEEGRGLRRGFRNRYSRVFRGYGFADFVELGPGEHVVNDWKEALPTTPQEDAPLPVIEAGAQTEVKPQTTYSRPPGALLKSAKSTNTFQIWAARSLSGLYTLKLIVAELADNGVNWVRTNQSIRRLTDCMQREVAGSISWLSQKNLAGRLVPS